MNNTHENEITNQTESIATITNALLEDLFNPSISTLDLCNLHALSLHELAATLESETFKHAQNAFERINAARTSIIEPESKALAIARLADQLKDKPESPSHAESQRKSANKLLCSNTIKIKRQPIPDSPVVHPSEPATLSSMNNKKNTHKSIAISTLAALTTLSYAGSTGTATEDYSTGIGLTTSYFAFFGSPCQAQITAPDSIWIGDVVGLETELENPFYNDTIGFPAGTPVLAFGPASLGSFIAIDFTLRVTDINFIIYDIETPNAVNVIGFNGNGSEVYDSGLLSASEFNQFAFTESFDPPVRRLHIRAQNSDGLMLSPIEISYAPLLCSPADLNDDGTLNFFDVSAFLSAFGAMEIDADFTGDGVYNFFDVSAFLSAYAAGCP